MVVRLRINVYSTNVPLLAVVTTVHSGVSTPSLPPLGFIIPRAAVYQVVSEEVLRSWNHPFRSHLVPRVAEQCFNLGMFFHAHLSEGWGSADPHGWEGAQLA